MWLLEFLANLVGTLLAIIPWHTGAGPDRRAIENARVRSGIRAVEGRVLNIGTEWSTGVCDVTPGHLRFEPNMGIVGKREIDVRSAQVTDLDFARSMPFGSYPTTTVLLETDAGELLGQVPVRVLDQALSLLARTDICPGCGHPMSDHIGPNGEFVSIPVDLPSTEVPEQSERDHLWELHDRGYMSDADYEAELRRLDGDGKKARPTHPPSA